LDEYAAFHAQQHGKSGAKYLLLYCAPATAKGIRLPPWTCTGLGKLQIKGLAGLRPHWSRQAMD
jgi:hypothetical protein